MSEGVNQTKDFEIIDIMKHLFKKAMFSFLLKCLKVNNWSNAAN